MIPANRLPAQPVRWQQLWRDAITDPRELLALLGLEDRAGVLLPRGDTGFAMRVPRGFVARMRPGDPADPLLRQVLPLADERVEVPGFAHDAVGDLPSRAAAGVLHKYEGRVLLVATGSCAVNCRYCFRRHFPYADETAAAHRWGEALGYLRGDPTVGEVILSGGDPLSLATPKLAELTAGLARIAHVRRLRIHTRLPVVLPLHPRTRKQLAQHGLELPDTVHVVDPVGYLEMVWLESHCDLVVTDSGGVQKEAYFHGKPCVTLRDETEWVELVEAGANVLAGADPAQIRSAMERAENLNDTPKGLYGQGDSAMNILSRLAGVTATA